MLNNFNDMLTKAHEEGDAVYWEREIIVDVKSCYGKRSNMNIK